MTRCSHPLFCEVKIRPYQYNLKRYANIITKSNEEDGIADFLEEVIIGNVLKS